MPINSEFAPKWPKFIRYTACERASAFGRSNPVRTRSDAFGKIGPIAEPRTELRVRFGVRAFGSGSRTEHEHLYYRKAERL